MRDDERSPPLPTLKPRQLWLIEQVPATALSGLDRGAITSANVVIYDRALASVVAEALPLGGYAEPLSFFCQESGRALSPRALQFAAEGWSVVQLVEASPCWRERLQQAPGELSGVSAAGDAAVRLIAKHGAERYKELGADLAVLPAPADDRDHDHPMTVIFGPVAIRSIAQPYPFTANGLAG
jgi:hypothetical protein